MYYALYQSPLGEIAITANDNGITALAFQEGTSPIELSPYTKKETTILQRTFLQLEEYFDGNRKTFELPLSASGTPFRQKVWQALTEIPFGKTVSYAWIANKLEKPKAVRAVGSANGANPIALIVPCHRVIGANKKLTGYAGGLALKAKLLMHEGAQFKVD